MFYQKVVLKNFAISTGNTCVGVYLLKSCRPLGPQVYEKEVPTQLISLNMRNFLCYLEEHLQMAASELFHLKTTHHSISILPTILQQYSSIKKAISVSRSLTSFLKGKPAML